MDIKGSPIECYEMDSCEYIDWIHLVVMANVANDDKNRDALLGILCGYLTSKIYLDDLRIGFNGTSAATFTAPNINPNGEDVAPGWHEIARKASEGRQIISQPVTLGAGGDFPGVDALAQHLIRTKIPAQWQNDPRLVVMVGSELAAAERLRLFSTAKRRRRHRSRQRMGKHHCRAFCLCAAVYAGWTPGCDHTPEPAD